MAMAQRVGRPSSQVEMDTIKYLKAIGIPVKDIAHLLGVSRQTIYNKIKDSVNASGFATYTAISDNELDLKVSRIKLQHPNNGEVMLAGYLSSEGIRVPRKRLRASVHRVDPAGIEERRRRAVRRRVYTVPYPNYVWHIDGNHKLIRWRFVVHGGVDGFSRMVTFLRCATNNKAVTVANSFIDAINTYGIPDRLRSDLGGENVDTWRIMMNYHNDQSSVIVGSSTHNERIERLWRDVRSSVLQPFAEMFRLLESEDTLDPLNDIDLFCLHHIYLPRINQNLNSFSHGWNHHRISTQGGRTPMQLHVVGLLTEAPAVTVPSHVPSTLNPGILIPESNEAVEVPESTFQPCIQLIQAMEVVNPLATNLSDFGKSLYLRTVQIVGTHLSNGCDDCIVG